MKNTYWTDSGRYQTTLKKYGEGRLCGRAKTLAGETVRCLENIYYEMHNNGGGNDLGEEYYFLAGLDPRIVNFETPEHRKSWDWFVSTFESVATSGEYVHWNQDDYGNLERVMDVVLFYVLKEAGDEDEGRGTSGETGLGDSRSPGENQGPAA